MPWGGCLPLGAPRGSTCGNVETRGDICLTFKQAPSLGGLARRNCRRLMRRVVQRVVRSRTRRMMAGRTGFRPVSSWLGKNPITPLNMSLGPGSAGHGSAQYRRFPPGHYPQDTVHRGNRQTPRVSKNRGNATPEGTPGAVLWDSLGSAAVQSGSRQDAVRKATRGPLPPPYLALAGTTSRYSWGLVLNRTVLWDSPCSAAAQSSARQRGSRWRRDWGAKRPSPIPTISLPAAAGPLSTPSDPWHVLSNSDILPSHRLLGGGSPD